jgi:hypothetical protein
MQLIDATMFSHRTVHCTAYIQRRNILLIDGCADCKEFLVFIFFRFYPCSVSSFHCCLLLLYSFVMLLYVNVIAAMLIQLKGYFSVSDYYLHGFYCFTAANMQRLRSENGNFLEQP